MQIRAIDEIEGVPLVSIRTLFRRAGLDGILSSEFVARNLGITRPKTARLIQALERRDFLVAVGDRTGSGERTFAWQLTKEGIRLRGATAAKPLRRQTADRLLSELLDRIRTLNSSSRFLARVKTAIVFGSYLGSADRIGDLDLAIELVPRDADFDKHIAANNRRVSEQLQRGRHFSNILEQAYWWQHEACHFFVTAAAV